MSEIETVGMIIAAIFVDVCWLILIIRNEIKILDLEMEVDFLKIEIKNIKENKERKDGENKRFYYGNERSRK